MCGSNCTLCLHSQKEHRELGLQEFWSHPPLHSFIYYYMMGIGVLFNIFICISHADQLASHDSKDKSSINYTPNVERIIVIINILICIYCKTAKVRGCLISWFGGSDHFCGC